MFKIWGVAGFFLTREGGMATGDAKDTSTSPSAQATKKAQPYITNDHTITAAEMEKLSLLDLNGR